MRATTISRHMFSRDVLTAGSPLVLCVTLSQVNEVLAMVGTLLGIAYLLWKWCREARGKKDAD
jgi:hypothetical protein